MWLWRSPTGAEIAAYLDRVQELPWSYSQIGATRWASPAGFAHDQSQIEVGAGEAAFQAAKSALLNWSMFPSEISAVFTHGSTTAPGQVVAVLLRAGAVKMLGACRIVYCVDESAGSRRRSSLAPSVRAQFGFAYGTLTDHAMMGEESFRVTWQNDNRVIYTIASFSRPSDWLGQVGYPCLRYQQYRFRRLSMHAMRSDVQRRLATEPDRFGRTTTTSDRKPVGQGTPYLSAASGGD